MIEDERSLRKGFSRLTELVEDLSRRTVELDPYSRQDALPSRQEATLWMELQTAMEELRVAMEELHVAGDELASLAIALEQQEQRYRDLFEAAPDGYIVTDPAGLVLEANRAAAELLNRPASFLTGKPLLAAIHPPDTRIFYEQLAKLRRHEPVQGVELRLRPRMSDPIPVVVSVSLALNAQHEVGSLRWLIHDVTENKAIEKALRESQARYQLLVENIKDYALILLDTEGLVTSWSAGAERIYGYPPQEILGQSIARLYRPEERADGKPERDLAQAEKEGRLEEQGWRIRRDGSRHWAEVVITAIREDGESLRGFAEVTRDITEAKRALDQLRQSEERFATAFRAAPVPSLISTFEDGRIVDANESFLALMDWTREEVVGRTTQEVGLVTGPPEGLGQLEGVEQKGRARNREIRFRTRDGELHTGLASFELIEIDNQPCILAMVQDITERKRQEQAIDLLQTITVSIDEAEDVKAALEVALRKVCEATGWILGQAWLPTPDGAAIECCAGHFVNKAHSPFGKVSNGLRFAPGEGLPGRVWSTRQHVWAGERFDDGVTARSEAARAAGIQAGMAFPVLVEDAVIAILEFFITESHAEDPRLVDLVSAVARQLGSVLRHKELEVERARNNQQLRGLSDAALEINGARSVPELLQTVCLKARLIIGAHLAMVSRSVDASLMQSVEAVLCSEKYAQLRDQVVPPDGMGIAKIVSQTNQAQRLSKKELEVDPGHKALQGYFQTEWPVQGWLAVPLIGNHERNLGVVQLVDRYEGEFTENDQAILEQLARMAALAYENLRLLEEVRTGRQRLGLLARQVLTAQEQERQRISRELHDEAGQDLTALKISLQLMQDSVPASETRLVQGLSEAVELTDLTMQQIRFLAQDLRPPALDTAGLIPTLRDLARDFARRTHLRLDFTTNPEVMGPFSEEASISLYRFLQEALTNIGKHAQATEVRVSLEMVGEEVRLAVQDNGLGFVRAPGPGSPVEGIGLLGMQERLELLGGRLEMQSESGAGVCIVAHLPITESK